MSRTKSLLRTASAAMSLGIMAMGMACDSEAPPKQDAASTQTAPAPAPKPAPVLGEAPKSAVRTSGRFVTQGSQGNKAEVQDLPEVEYAWTMEGGSIVDGSDTPVATYSVDDAASVVRLYCRLKNAQGQEFTAVALQTAVAPPVLDSFTVTPPVVTAGTQAQLAWTAKEIKSLTLDPGGIDVTKMGAMPIQIAETTTYTLKAVNLAGTSVSRQLTVKAVPPPEIKSFGADGRILVGQTFTLKAEFANGKGEIKQGDTVLASSDQSPMTVQLVAGETTTVVLTVTNEAGVALTQTRTFQRSGN